MLLLACLLITKLAARAPPPFAMIFSPYIFNSRLLHQRDVAGRRNNCPGTARDVTAGARILHDHSIRSGAYVERAGRASFTE